MSFNLGAATSRVLSLALLTTACSSDDGGGKEAAGDAGPGPVPSASFDFTAFDAALEAALAEQGLPGASVAVVHRDHGEVHLRGYGEFDKDRLYLIASSSKILSAGILMTLVDEGKLDIDAPISDYLGAWGTHKTDITTAQLVSNSSGLVSLTDNPIYAPYICQYLPAPPDGLSGCAQTIYTADDVADRKTPDTEFHYGGGQWQLAGGIAEVVSGKTWAELVKANYVDGCGASSLAYTNQFAQSLGASGGNLGGALSYPSFFQEDLPDIAPTDNPNIEGGAYITATDYGKLLLMHLRGGRCGDESILTEASVDRMQEDRVAKYGSTGSPALAGYGMGWWVDRDNPGVFVDPGAYGAVALIDRTRNYGAFIVIESESAKGALISVAVRPALEAAIDAAVPQTDG